MTTSVSARLLHATMRDTSKSLGNSSCTSISQAARLALPRAYLTCRAHLLLRSLRLDVEANGVADERDPRRLVCIIVRTEHIPEAR